jgi:hypothetical protein
MIPVDLDKLLYLQAIHLARQQRLRGGDLSQCQLFLLLLLIIKCITASRGGRQQAAVWPTPGL